MEMTKQQAVRLLGGNSTVAARAIGIRSQAVVQWPDDLPPRIVDRVVAAVARQYVSEQVLIAQAEHDAQARERKTRDQWVSVPVSVPV